jgi:type II secretory pathway component GspD/PulD (secretin)
MATADLLAAAGRRRRPALVALALIAVCASVAGAVLGYRSYLARSPAPRAVEHPAPSPVASGLRVRPLSDWLADVAAEAGLGLVIAPEIGGEVAADFPERASWQERIEVLSRIHGFDFDVGNTLIEVRPLPPERRSDAVDSSAAASRAGPPRATEASAPPSRADDARSPAAIDTSLEAGGAPGEASGDTETGGAETASAAHERHQRSENAPAACSEEPEVATVAYAVLRLTNARAADLEDVVAPALRASRGSVTADPASNALVVTGEAEAVAAARRLVAELDIARRRFLLEAQIVELSRNARSELGVQWSVDGDVGALVDFPAADTPREEAGIIVATDGAHSLRARIGALEAAGRVRIISRPRVVTVEGKPASIESVRILRVRFPDHTALVADGEDVSVAGSSRAVEEIPVGVSLIVEPALQGQGDIVLRIKAKSSTLGSPQPPDDIPEELSRMVDAEVVVADGETAVLGGLRREGRSRSGAGVPVLRSVPWLGKLFGRHVDEREGEELIVLVTPHLLP